MHTSWKKRSTRGLLGIVMASALVLSIGGSAWAYEGSSSYLDSCPSNRTAFTRSVSPKGTVSHSHNGLGPKNFINTSSQTRFWGWGLRYQISWEIISSTTLTSATIQCDT